MNTNSTLGRTGVQVPRMGLGAMVWGQPRGLSRWTPAQMAYGPSENATEEERALEASLSSGVNLIDTAAMYSNGASEQRVGEVTRGKDVLIATKFPPSPFARAEDFPRWLQGSLDRLGREHIDLYQHHFPSRRMDIPRVMSMLADAVEASKVRAVGVSNYSAEQMRLAHSELGKRGIPLASNQVMYSLVHRQPEVDGVLEACRELGITLIAYSPMGMGMLTGKYSSRTRAGGLRQFMPDFRGQNIEAVQPLINLLHEIGSRYHKTPAQVAVRWLIENPLVLPIPGAKNSRQAEENAGALTFTLSGEDMDALNQASLSWRK